ncbi:uncharacterized protein PSFLO_04851 [Pseudozyma flocculosa]|nr:uncharacterized protein PSFLO_04851 [Pseudozyma flocculosa]
MQITTKAGSAASAGARHSILNLPLVPPQQRLTLNLLPDPVAPSPAALIGAPESSPSLVRRARPVLQGSHFSYLSPLPLSFPYEFPAEEAEEAESLGNKLEREIEQEQNDANKDAELTEEQQQAKELEAHRKRMRQIEVMMQRYEVQPSSVGGGASAGSTSKLEGHLPPGRLGQHFPSARLLSISPAALEDCLPHLDIGDSLEWIKSQHGRARPESYSSGPMASPPSSDAAKARFELSDLLSGRLIGAQLAGNGNGQSADKDAQVGTGTAYLAHKEAVEKGAAKDETDQERIERRIGELEERRRQGDDVGYAPWSLCYAGHQFGSWAGQLGDGRAITLLETKDPTTGERWDIQLKGAGRTPYSRFADGLATLGSSVREFLGSEAMGALGVPTSRALAVVSIPDLKVLRERINGAAITTRLCPSWLRIGSFQIHSSRSEWESSRMLGEYVARDLFGWTDVVKGGSIEAADAASGVERKPWARRLIEEVARRNARTIALWQVNGFMHGVMNTDNISLLGHTIDYGPYAFMDIFDEGQICNHSDGEGRYAYRLQPTMGVFAIRELVNALAPLVGFEIQEGRAPAPGDLLRLKSDEINALKKLAREQASEEIETTFTSTLMDEWKRGWAKRLGLQDAGSEDGKGRLIEPLLAALADLDFPTTLRSLCRLPAFLKAHGLSGAIIEGDSDMEARLKEVLRDFALGDKAQGREGLYDEKVVPEYMRSAKMDQFRPWLLDYAKRLLQEGRDGDQVTAEMKKANPRFVLRNWVTTEVVEKLEKDNDTEALERVLQMCIRPFEDWGLPAEGKSEEQVSEEARLCSIGRSLTGNLPSCSS